MGVVGHKDNAISVSLSSTGSVVVLLAVLLVVLYTGSVRSEITQVVLWVSLGACR